MRIELSKKRRDEIKSAVIKVLRQYGNIRLPVPIKNIVKSLNYRLVPYSTFMKDLNLSYEETIKHLGTEDACSEYTGYTNVYVIYFNDIDKLKIDSNRVRWNIAHELGHIVLGHHSNERSRIFRNSISDKEYNQYEEEADKFASYLLVPNIVLSFQDIEDKYSLAKTCKISKTAASYRYTDLLLWAKKHKIESYDKEILKLYNMSTINQEHVYCLKCGTLTGYNGVNYCYICGYRKKVYRKLGNNMIYAGIELDESKRTVICPVCNNEQLGNDDIFCKICGFQLYNMCTEYLDHSCSNNNYLDGNARYCHICGSVTTFFRHQVLSPWDRLSESESDSTGLDDELPF